MSKKVMVGIITILIALSVTAVVAYQHYGGLLPVGVPEVVDVNLSWGEVTYDTTRINVELVIYNPNPIRVTVKIEDPEIYVNDIKFAWTKELVEVDLPKESNSKVSFVLVVDNNKIQEVWVSHIQRDEVSMFKVEAKLTLLKLPISREKPVSTNMLEQVEDRLEEETG